MMFMYTVCMFVVCAVSKDYAAGEETDTGIQVGSLVQVAGIELEIWKMMQEGHGGWNDEMEKVGLVMLQWIK